MNFTFSNPSQRHKMIVNDEGVTITHVVGTKAEEHTWFFPYGSIDSISVKLASVSISAKAGEISAYYYFNGDRSQYKKMHDEILKLNRLAEKAEAKFSSTAEPLVLEKTFDSFKKYFAGLTTWSDWTQSLTHKDALLQINPSDTSRLNI